MNVINFVWKEKINGLKYYCFDIFNTESQKKVSVAITKVKHKPSYCESTELTESFEHEWEIIRNNKPLQKIVNSLKRDKRVKILIYLNEETGFSIFPDCLDMAKDIVRL